MRKSKSASFSISSWLIFLIPLLNVLLSVIEKCDIVGFLMAGHILKKYFFFKVLASDKLDMVPK